MENPGFNENSPKAFILAAGDWSKSAMEEDQVWSLVLNHSEFHPFHLYTTYGLSARSVQVFPEILVENQRLSAEDDFKQPPTITHYSPGFLRIVYQLNNGLALQFDCLTPEPSILLGTITLKNQGDANLDFQVLLGFHLLPLGKGIRTRVEKIRSHQILSGQTGDLFPILFMTGGPIGTYTPYPALTLPIQMAPGKSQTATWVLAAKHTRDDSFQTARNKASFTWPQVAQKHLMDHARHTLQITTGYADWDRAFYLAQTIPDTHFIHHQSKDAAPSVVRTRLPDQQAVTTRNLSENDDLTTLELTHLAQVLLPQRPDLMVSLVKKFLNQLQEGGQLYAKRNASPFMKPYQEPPLLAGLSIEIFEINRDESFLKEIFIPLTHVTQAWLFSDSGAHKEKPLAWQTPDQSQLHAGHFVFDIWEESGGGLNIETVESPALLAMLLREIRSLQKMAEILGNLSSIERYAVLEARLNKELERFWNNEQQVYLYRDIQSQNTPAGEQLLTAKFRDAFAIERKFDTAQRLVCHLVAADQRTRVCHLKFTGLDLHGQELAEEFKPGEVRWISGHAHLTTRNLFTALNSLMIKGLTPEDEIRLETADLTKPDITCLAPIWSGKLSNEHLQSLLKETLDWQHPNLRRGIPEVFPHKQEPPEELQIAVNVLWNTLIIQGLARNECTETAASLFSSLMDTIVEGLRNYAGFYPFFQLQDGKPIGSMNAIAGLAPLRLFLEIAGVRILHPAKVAVWGENPFPWPIDVSWRGLSIHRENKRTQITFPDGTTCTTETTEPVTITPGEVAS